MDEVLGTDIYYSEQLVKIQILCYMMASQWTQQCLLYPLPINDDFNTWNECHHAIFSNSLKIWYTLSEFNDLPHFKDRWFCNTDRSELYFVKDPASYDDIVHR